MVYTVVPQSTYDRTKSQAILKYVRSVSTDNSRTGIDYLRRLLMFEEFIKENYSFSIDELLIRKTFTVDVYDLLSIYVSWLKSKTKDDGSRLLSDVTIKNRVITVKNFLEYFDVLIYPHTFKKRVKIPRVVTQYKEALTKEEIIRILNACSDIKLKTYLVCLAVTGCRAAEMCSLRLKDIDWDENRIDIRGEFTKTKVGRYCFITDECKDFLRNWIEHKYRTRRIYLENKGNRYVTPIRREEDLVFSSSFTYDGELVNASRTKTDTKTKAKKKIADLDVVTNLYTVMVNEFNELMRQLNIGYEDNNRNRHIFTLHSFRRYLRTLISDLGYQDFAEFTLGHSNSTYWRKSTRDKYALFKKIEPQLLLLDQSAIQRRGADQQSRIEYLEQENYELKSEFEKVHEAYSETKNDRQQKDDALATLSDQVMKLTTEVQELKKNNNNRN
jgi:integrase